MRIYTEFEYIDAAIGHLIQTDVRAPTDTEEGKPSEKTTHAEDGAQVVVSLGYGCFGLLDLSN